MPNSDKLIKQGIKYTDQLFAEINKRLEQGVLSSDTLEAFLEKTKEYTTANPLVTTGYDTTMLNLILSETNNYKFSRPSQKELVRVTIENRVGDLIQDVGEDIKQNVRDIAKAEYTKGSNPQKIAKQITEKVEGIKNKRARTIARTEVARASTVSDYVINKERGATGFTVSCRSTRCAKCKEAFCKDSATGGDVEYSMDDVSVLPPLHPNCRCSVEFTFDMDKFKGKVSVQKPTSTTTTTTETVEKPTTKSTEFSSMVQGNYEIYTERDKRSKAETTVYKFENGLEIGINSKAHLTFEEVLTHIESLPEPLKTINDLNRINICGHHDATAGGRFYPRENKVEVYLSAGNKVHHFDTLNHELAHAFDYSKGEGENYGLSVKAVYEKIFKKDNELYTYINERTGRKKTPKKFPTDYAARNFIKYGKSFKKRLKAWEKGSKTLPKPTNDFTFGEDFAESTKLYLNPSTHAKFVKDFPNRAKYLEDIYGKPVFNENNPINQAINHEENAKNERELQRKRREEQNKSFENLSKKEMDKHLEKVVGKENIESYYELEKELERITAVRRTLFTGEPQFMIDVGYSPSQANEYANNVNKYLKKVKKDYEKYKSTIDNINNLIKENL